MVFVVMVQYWGKPYELYAVFSTLEAAEHAGKVLYSDSSKVADYYIESAHVFEN